MVVIDSVVPIGILLVFKAVIIARLLIQALFFSKAIVFLVNPYYYVSTTLLNDSLIGWMHHTLGHGQNGL